MNLFARFLVIILVLGTSRLALAAPVPLQLTYDPDADQRVVTVYHPETGMVTMRANRLTLAAYYLASQSGLFRPVEADPEFAIGPFDEASEFKMFTLRTEGFKEVTVGAVLPTQLTAELLLSDLLVDASIMPSAGPSPPSSVYANLYIVPEPSSVAPMMLGCLFMCARQRCRRA